MHNVTKSLIVQEDISFGEEVESQLRGGTTYPNLNKLRLIYPVNSLGELESLDTSKFRKAIVFEGDSYSVYRYYSGAWNLASTEANIYTYDTVASLANVYLSIDSKLSTKGCLSIGDGGHGVYIVKAASGTPDGYSRILLGNGNHAVLLPTNGKYAIKQFGVVGDGIVNDTVAITRYHTFCNTVNATTSYKGLSSILVNANAQISVQTGVDFANIPIKIANGIVGTPVGESTLLKCFIINDPTCPVVTATGSVAAINLVKGSSTPTLGLFDGHGFAQLECAFQVPNRAKTGTMNYTQAFKVNRLGVCSQPLSVDLQAYTAAITVSYRKTSKTRLEVQNIRLEDENFNSFCLLRIERCNVKVSNFTVLTNSESGTYVNADRIISIHSGSDIYIEDFITTGRQVSTSIGSYALEADGAADVYVAKMNALTGWGATGTNNINGLHYINCVLNRVDTHSSAHNIFVDNSTINGMGVIYGWGGGVIKVTNCEVIDAPVIATRSDYGGTFFGDLIASNITVHAPGTSTYYAIDLLSNPLGASTTVACPNKITVNQLNRVSKSASTAELVPVAIKISGTSVVTAPELIDITNIYSLIGWRFGLRLDLFNMERSVSSSVTRLNVSNVHADAVTSGSASVLSTGVLDFASVLTPSTRPGLVASFNDVWNIGFQSKLVTGLTINFSNNSIINAVVVDTASGTQPTIRYDNCKFTTPASGFTSAPVGGTTSGTSAYTSVQNCEIANSAFDFSLVAALMGNLVRSNGSAITWPAGVTATIAFTGYRKAGFFAT